jgi:protein SCO1/2
MRILKRTLYLAFLLACLIPFAPPRCLADGQAVLTDIAGHMPDLRFSLTGDTGGRTTAADYRERVTLLFFGFTRCPDICPTTLARLRGLLRDVGPGAGDIRVLFATMDPAHDTPPVLHDYLGRYRPLAVTGLTGTDADMAAFATRYRAAYRPAHHYAQADGIVHSAAIYVFGKDGKARFLITPADTDTAIIAALRALAGE